MWDKSFIGGSVLATFCQGVVLGAVINGIPVVNRTYAGGALDWLTPFTLFCGFALVVAYALLGCTWLIMKTEGRIAGSDAQARSNRCWWSFLLVDGGGQPVDTAHPRRHRRPAGSTRPNLYWFLPVPVLVVLVSAWMFRAISKNAHHAPFLLTLALVFLGYTGLGISIWPNIIPPSISIWEAASPPQSQGFILVGALFIIPIILVYTFWSYYVFRGKVTPDQGYH